VYEKSWTAASLNGVNQKAIDALMFRRDTTVGDLTPSVP
jgi:hypothetical protein